MAARYALGRVLRGDLHTPMERVVGIEREREKERHHREKRERTRRTREKKEKKKEEKKKGSAFAQHLPDYSFRRPGGFTDGKRVRDSEW